MNSTTNKTLIGEGGHWNVYRVPIFADDHSLGTKIQKFPKRGGNVEANLRAYQYVKNSGLPTLGFLAEKTQDGIKFLEAEDLNPMCCDGLFVSPNTLRSANTVASLIVAYCNGAKNESDLPFIEKYVTQGPISNETMQNLYTEYILEGAEKFVFNNKIEIIENFSGFLEKSKALLDLAQNQHIEIFTDAYFFKVRSSDHIAEFKIADFDNIKAYEKNEIPFKKLRANNLQQFKNAFEEFIESFVHSDLQRECYRCLKDV